MQPSVRTAAEGLGARRQGAPIYVCAHIYTYLCMYKYTCTYIYIYTDVQIYKCIYIDIYTYTV